MEGPTFLVRLDGSYFFADMSGREVSATDVPSAARHFAYSEADRLCQVLVRRGYRSAVVTDIAGAPITFSALRSELAAPKGNNIPGTLADLDRMPAAECRRRYRSDPAFRARVDEISLTQRNPE